MTQQEKAEKYAEGYRCPSTNENEYCKHDIISAYNNGYTQCQKDMADKKYTEEDIKNAINVGMSAEAGDYPKGWSFDCGISLEDYFINSLNKK